MTTKTKGTMLIIIPPALLILVPILSSIWRFVALQKDIPLKLMQTVNVLFSLHGIIGVIGIFVLIPWGIYILVKKVPPQNPMR